MSPILANLFLHYTFDLATCGLVLHPQKTKIVYCADTNRRGRYPTVQFDFLGYTFPPRFMVWSNGTYGVSFLPAASSGALKAMRREVRQWRLQSRTTPKTQPQTSPGTQCKQTCHSPADKTSAKGPPPSCQRCKSRTILIMLPPEEAKITLRQK